MTALLIIRLYNFQPLGKPVAECDLEVCCHVVHWNRFVSALKFTLPKRLV